MRRTLYKITALSITALAAFALAGCTEGSSLSGPTAAMSAPPPPSRSISDAAHNGGTAGFYFLPPLVAQPSDTGVFDAHRSVSVTVCQLGKSAADSLCTAPAVTVSAPTVDVNGNHYQSNWQTDAAVFPADLYYRISVVDNATHAAYGHVDVFLGSTGRGFHSINQSEFTPLLDGRTVPIKFRISVGAQAPTAGGTTGGTGGTPGDTTGGGTPSDTTGLSSS